MMNNEAIKKRIEVNGGIKCLVQIQFNNSGIVYVYGDNTVFNPETDLLVLDNGEELIRFKGAVVGGTNGIKSKCIPNVTEKPSETVEGLVFITNSEDMDRIDRADIIMA